VAGEGASSVMFPRCFGHYGFGSGWMQADSIIHGLPTDYDFCATHRCPLQRTCADAAIADIGRDDPEFATAADSLETWKEWHAKHNVPHADDPFYKLYLKNADEGFRSRKEEELAKL
jgi:hypothetical protein